MLEGIECQAVGYSIETQVCFLKLKKNIFNVINVNWQWVQGYASKHVKWMTAGILFSLKSPEIAFVYLKIYYIKMRQI